MFKILFVLMAITLQSLNALTISKSKEFTLEHQPKFKQTSFDVTIEHNDQNIIENKIQTISKSVKKSDICTGGQYRIRPNYRWENKTKINLGYTSNIRFSCTFVDKKVYELLLDSVKSVSGIKLNQNEIRFIQTKEDKIEQTKKLEDLAFKYAKRYAKRLNNSFESCKIDSINLNSNYSTFTTQPDLMRLSKVQMDAESKVTVPINDTFKNSIKVDYKFLCN